MSNIQNENPFEIGDLLIGTANIYLVINIDTYNRYGEASLTLWNVKMKQKFEYSKRYLINMMIDNQWKIQKRKHAKT